MQDRPFLNEGDTGRSLKPQKRATSHDHLCNESSEMDTNFRFGLFQPIIHLLHEEIRAMLSNLFNLSSTNVLSHQSSTLKRLSYEKLEDRGRAPAFTLPTSATVVDCNS